MVGFLQSITKIKNPIDLVVSGILTIGIAVLSYYLYKVLLPNGNPQKAKKDNDGNHILK